MTAVEPIGPASQELPYALEELWIRATPRDGVWEAGITEGGHPVVRLRIRERWWELHLKTAAWSGGRRAAYEAVASGAAAGELFIYRAPKKDTQLRNRPDGRPTERSEIMCRIVAWLPHMQLADAQEQQDASRDRPTQLDLSGGPIEEIGIGDLREAIRANRVSFPSQVPTFPKHARPDLQCKLAQLYFVLGWNYGNIGARYGLARARVGQILNTWRRRAVETGYIQLIPPSEAISAEASLKVYDDAHKECVENAVKGRGVQGP